MGCVVSIRPVQQNTTDVGPHTTPPNATCSEPDSFAEGVVQTEEGTPSSSFHRRENFIDASLPMENRRRDNLMDLNEHFPSVLTEAN